MRILITGCTAMQVNSPRKVNDLISNLESIKAALEWEGHWVEWKDVVLGESLECYDHIFISLAPFTSWGTRYMGGCLWALATHPSITITADDWQVRGIQSSAYALIIRDDYFEKTIWSHWDKLGYGCGPYDYRSVLKKMVRVLAHHEWPFNVLVPCWDGGDLSYLKLPGNVIRYDPSPFMRRYPCVHPPAKNRQWVMASLTAKDDWLKKLSLQWPVKRYGNVRQGQEKLPENMLQDVYCANWGIMSPPHNVSKSGWFRVRYWMAYHANSVMLCGIDEARVLGGAYLESTNPTQIEKLNDDSLYELVSWQGQALVDKSWTRNQVLEVVNQLITG